MSLPRTIHSGATVSVTGTEYPNYGTIGAGVADAWGNNYALSCTHVFAAWNNGNPVGRSIQCPSVPGEQPDLDLIGQVYKWTDFDGTDNFVDAALAKIDSTKAHISNEELRLVPTQETLYKPVLDFDEFSGKSAVIHSPRKQINATIGRVQFGKVFDFEGRHFSFSDILNYDTLGDLFEGGDSGSAVVDSDSGQFLGIHFAADNARKTGYCILASLIWSYFKDFSLALLP